MMRATTAFPGSIAALLAVAGCAMGSPPPFTFHAVEFAPADQRRQLAQDFLRRHASPGTPIDVAMAALRRANAPCHSLPGHAPIQCRYSRLASNSALDGLLGDVTWTVTIMPSDTGTVAAATVIREVRGL